MELPTPVHLPLSWVAETIPSSCPSTRFYRVYRPLGGGQRQMRWPWHFLSPTSQSHPGRRGRQVSHQWDKADGWSSF